MTKRTIVNQYHFWLTGLVCDEHHQRNYQGLFDYLDDTEFTWFVSNDMNRSADGMDLRSRFADEYGYDYLKIRPALSRPCSVLEMMVGLACRCEEGIMGDSKYGDRTDQWFWVMIYSLGLDRMDDDNFDEQYVQCVVDALLNRTYRRDGKGGLFTVPKSKKDLRKIEIWYQMCWYLDTIVDE